MGSFARFSGKTLIATSRPRRVSFARYTSPMPPAPSALVISYGPRVLPIRAAMCRGFYQPPMACQQIKRPPVGGLSLGTCCLLLVVVVAGPLQVHQFAQGRGRRGHRSLVGFDVAP